MEGKSTISVIEKIIMSTIHEWRKMYVNEYYVEKLKDFLSYVRKHSIR